MRDPAFLCLTGAFYMKKAKRLGYLAAFLLFLGIEVLIALYVRDAFIRPYFGDVLAVAVVYCFCRIFVRKGGLLPLWVFLFAVLVEFTQYFHLVQVLGLGGIAPLRILLGGTFDWGDIACYGAGMLLLFAWQAAEKRITRNES